MANNRKLSVSQAKHVVIRLITSVREVFDDPETLLKSKLFPGAFSRPYKLPFNLMLRIGLTNIRKNGTNLLNDFFQRIISVEQSPEMRTAIEDLILDGDVDAMNPSQQAYSKARKKMNHMPYLLAFAKCTRFLYGEENRQVLETYEDMFEFAIDGSDVPMPNLPSMAALYGTKGRGNDSPTSRLSLCFDTLNRFVIDPQFGSMDCDERTMALAHLHNIEEFLPLDKCLFIFDRGYPSIPLIEFCIDKKTHFLMRTRRKFNLKIDAVKLPRKNGISDEIVDLSSDDGTRQLKVRIIKFYLPSGEVETLTTNLFDLSKKMFKDLYFQRWKIELENDIIKNKLEMANFTGRTENTIRQDVWCAILLSVLCSAAKNLVDCIIHEEEQNTPAELDNNASSICGKSAVSMGNKHKYQAKMSIIIHETIPMIAGIIFRPDIHLLERELQLFIIKVKRSKIPISDGTRRPERKQARRARYHHNRKSCTL